MDDLISRQAAIDYCYQLINVEYQQGSDEMNYVQERVSQTETILHHLEFMPSAQPEQRRIPCSERLPEGNTIVLATTADYMYIVEFEVYSNGHMYWNEVNEYRSIEGVIAWMPLPSSFKEE